MLRVFFTSRFAGLKKIHVQLSGTSRFSCEGLQVTFKASLPNGQGSRQLSNILSKIVIK